MTDPRYLKPIRRSELGWTLVRHLLPPQLQPAVRAAYAAEGRHYHDGQHVGGIWETWTNIRAMMPDYRDTSLLIATIFHDIVYNPAAKPGENEEASALLLIDMAKGLPEGQYGLLNGADVMEAVHMICGTADHQQAGDALKEGLAVRVRLFCDLDLSGMACPWEEFDDNTRLIRLEYGHLSDEAFRAGRVAFFEKMLTRPIYRSGLVPEWWEEQARENIQRAVSRA